MGSFSRYLLYAGLAGLALALLSFLIGQSGFTGPLLIIGFLVASLGMRDILALKGYAYTTVIFAVVSAGMFYPQYFTTVGNYELSDLIMPLLQVIMFGMGTTMTFDDFVGVIKAPRAVIIGVCCQFAIMPTLGFIIANLFNFPAEIAAGVILIGCSPSGLASNVMALIAKANVALSITITTIATLLAPIMTPLLMKYLAGQFIEINFWKMVWDITQIIIIPLAIGFIINQFFKKFAEWLKDYLPLISMAGIAFILLIIIAAGQQSLLNVGGLLIVAVLMHNIGGFILGYSAAKLFRMPEQDCRTVAIEVGLQNGGLASGLANQMGKLATVGLAAALFGPIMNITGSILASWWGRKPVEEK
ncbi:MAG: bile acid:sodium symporter family protein [Haliscomenobacter sp.]|uniref:bile acid:sodium symporter family protein n=1 Tax=Haliscomenobacter sp. TaxID=2717303 RepID=UPI0029B45D13|nr:bile acid:sodium symporter family protein [Haliscomenobacter sp.]MDX2072621.1 bile acid:sodium symporter family protein [Haliscomenobacter sp.]